MKFKNSKRSFAPIKKAHKSDHQAFFEGTYDDNMGNDIVDFFSNVMQKASTPTATVPTYNSNVLPVVSSNNSQYIKYIMYAGGGLLGLFLLIKLMKAKKA